MSDVLVDAIRPETPEPGRQLYVSWLLATFAGWLAGLFLVISAAVLGDLLGFGGFQVMLGLGMGAGVGFMQERIVRHWFGPARPWLWASVIGMGVPFLASDLLGFVRAGNSVSMLLTVAAGGLLAGYLQSRFLGNNVARARWWIVASLAGWVLAAGTTVASRWLTGVLSEVYFYGALINLVLILLGGVVLGAVTGLALLKIFER